MSSESPNLYALTVELNGRKKCTYHAFLTLAERIEGRMKMKMTSRTGTEGYQQRQPGHMIKKKIIFKVLTSQVMNPWPEKERRGGGRGGRLPRL